MSLDPFDVIFEKIYYDPSNSSSFGSVTKLLKKAKERNSSIKRKDVEEWLSGQDAYTLHRSVKRKFYRVPTFAEHIDSVWQIDTADVRHLQNPNDGIKYLLVIVDVLSRYAFVTPMKTKHAQRVIQAFKDIKKKYGRSPQRVVSDPGLEFRGSFTEYCKKQGIYQLLLRKEQKAPLAERFIRTLKEKMEKYMTANNTRRYIDNLQNFVDSYLTAIHSRLKMRPIDVRTKDEERIKERFYGNVFGQEEAEKFEVGDLVRIVKKRKPLEKGTTKSTTDEVFIIHSIDREHFPRVLYSLEDIKGDVLRGRFYSDELVKVKNIEDPKQYMRVGKTRVKTTKRKTQEFKTFTGWSRKHDIKLK